MSEIYHCTWDGNELLSEDGAFDVIRSKNRITQMGEPYGPVTGTKFLPIDPYLAINQGRTKPNTDILITYVLC